MGGFSFADVVRAHYYITDAAYADIVFPILGETFGDIRPAATMIVCGLNKPEMKIEIEVTALRAS
jgi:enamine deaminase RidA (YjgF/YER057c/UK114 family)